MLFLLFQLGDGSLRARRRPGRRGAAAGRDQPRCRRRPPASPASSTTAARRCRSIDLSQLTLGRPAAAAPEHAHRRSSTIPDADGDAHLLGLIAENGHRDVAPRAGRLRRRPASPTRRAYLGPVATMRAGWCSASTSATLLPPRCATCCSDRPWHADAVADFEELLQAAIGLDVASIGVVGHRARGAAAAVGLPAGGPRDAYWDTSAACADRAAGADRSGRRARDLVLPRPRGLRRARPHRPRRVAARRTRRRAAAAQPAVLDRRGAVLDGDGAARRRPPGGPLSHRRRRHQRAGAGARRRARVRQQLVPRQRPGIPRSLFRADAGRGSPAATPCAGRSSSTRATCLPPICCRGGTLRRHLLPQSADLFRSRRRRTAPSLSLRGC